VNDIVAARLREIAERPPPDLVRLHDAPPVRLEHHRAAIDVSGIPESAAFITS
jgi:hypothetical protein